MENASKALIIAGAILLAILLISLGIYIFTGAQDVTKNSGLDAQEVSVFNSAILKYEGRDKSASDVRAVKNEVIAANKKLSSEGKTAIKINRDTATNFGTSDLSESQRKNVIRLQYDSTTGIVSNVVITYVKADGSTVNGVEQ